MKQAILVVSFGSTHSDTLEKAIAAVERRIAQDHGAYPCFRAFTSGIVRRRLAQKGMIVDSPELALQKLEQQGFTHVWVQPTLLLPGEEYDGLREAVTQTGQRMQIQVGRPLLWEEQDFGAMVRILKESYPMPADTVLLAMGHGTAHSADCCYDCLREKMRAEGMELCTVEGRIGFADAVQSLLLQPKRKVHLVPLLLVAGDHSRNDMAGDGEDSLKSLLTRAGFEVSFSLRGLGELEAIQKMLSDRVGV